MGFVLRDGVLDLQCAGGRSGFARAAWLEPTWAASSGIVLVIHLVAAAVAVGAVWAASSLVTSIRLNPAEAVYYGQLASIPLSFLAIALMLAVFLPTTLFRGFVIALIYLVVAVIVWIALRLRWRSCYLSLAWPSTA